MKSTFFERFAAYFIDTIIISIIFTLICFGLPKTTSDAEKRMLELDEQLQTGEITSNEYLSEYLNSSLQYEYQKDNVLSSGVFVAITIAYFVIFQYLNKGQTLGKKILKLRVVDKTTEKPVSIGKGLIRSLLIDNIVSNLLIIIFIYILNENTYLTGYLIAVGIETLFIIITAMLILYKKDGLGLHDMIMNTKVIKERG